MQITNCLKLAHPSTVALDTTAPVRNRIMGIRKSEQDEMRWLMVNSVPLFKQGTFDLYEVYTTFSNITDIADTTASPKVKDHGTDQ